MTDKLPELFVSQDDLRLEKLNFKEVPIVAKFRRDKGYQSLQSSEGTRGTKAPVPSPMNNNPYGPSESLSVTLRK